MEKILLNILKKIEKNGYVAYIVGGYVRDKLLGINSNDVDICTNALPKDIIEILNLDKTKTDNYGCINIKTKRFNIDITTFREETKYENRKPKTINYINDVKTDLKRRDFTINTLLINYKGKIIDNYNAKKDLENKIIKCVGNTKEKLTEDPLRILRAIRFSIVYNFKLDKEILEFIKENKSLLNSLSYYRKKEELDKILISKSKITGLDLLKELDLLKYLKIDYDVVNYTNDLLGMYAQINFDKNYPFTKNEKDIINNIRKIINNKKIDNKTLYTYGLYVNIVAGEILGLEHVSINKMYKSLPIKTRKDIKISSQEIIKYVKNYNNISHIYSDLENNIISNKLKNNYKSIVKFLKEWESNE